MKKGVFFIVVLLAIAIDPTTAQVFQVPIFVSDGVNGLTLTLGVDPNGTDGFDLGLDLLAPPPAPVGAFDARYRIASEDYFTDIRFNSITQKTFTMLYQAASGQGPIVLTWNRNRLASLGTFLIVDNINGTLFGPLDMTTTGTLDVSTVSPPGILDAGLRVLVTPRPPVTRYVAPGGNDTGNDCTNQANPCATIGHAVGQANNDDTLNLAAGLYNEPGLLFEKRLNIQGAGIIVQ